MTANLANRFRTLHQFGAIVLVTLTMWGCDSATPNIETTSHSTGDEALRTIPETSVEINQEARQQAWARIVPRLEQFQADVVEDALDSIDIVSNFFTERRRGARPFAEELLSYWGKFQYVRGYFDTEAHDRYLKDCFSRHIFKPEELTAVIESAASQFASKMRARENQLLVDIRADLGDEALGAMSGLQAPSTDAEFRHQFEAMLVQVAPIISRDVGVEVAKQVVDWNIASPIVMKLGTALATRLGISGTILAGGAYSGAASLGIGLVVGILIDQFLDWVFRQAGYDPVAELESKIEITLDGIEALILDGRWQPPGPMPTVYDIVLTEDGWVNQFTEWDEFWAARPIELQDGECLVEQFDRYLSLRGYALSEALYQLIVGETSE